MDLGTCINARGGVVAQAVTRAIAADRRVEYRRPPKRNPRQLYVRDLRRAHAKSPASKAGVPFRAWCRGAEGQTAFRHLTNDKGKPTPAVAELVGA